MRYPELAAGGFSRVDGVVDFFTRVQALLDLLPEGAVVVDYGAGRGESAINDEVAFRRKVQDLRGPGRRVIGLDVADAVLDNPRVDEAHVITDRIPLPDASVDLIVSDHTFEHVDDAAAVAAELGRVLKPGGWICARTPNKWGYISIGARIVPNRAHVKALSRLQPHRHEVDVFPTRYRMNTLGALRALFPSPAFEVAAYQHDAEPDNYARSSKALTAVLAVLHRLPSPLKSIWMIFIRKAG